MVKPSALLVSALVALSAAGCMTKRVRMEPSPAVKEARAHAREAKVHPAQLCASVTLDAQAPLVVPFPYDKPDVSEDGADLLNDAAAWLTCHAAGVAALAAEGDTTGDAAHRQQLAAERVKAMRAYLATRGVAPARVVDRAPGAGEVLTITARGRGW